MVSIEDILKRVQQAETETERQWILLELQMSQMPDDLVSMLWAAAIPHFFDANILAALRPELAEQADKLYEKLKTLTFVEEFPKQGYNIHELTRNVLLNQLWQQDKDEFLRLSQRAADYFFSGKMSSEEDVEFCYHEILNEGEAQTGRLLDRGFDWWTYHQIERLQAAVQGFREHEIADRLDAFGKGFSLHLQGVVKIRSGHYAEAESFLSRTETFYKEINLKNLRYITTLLRDIGKSKQEQGDYDSSVYFYENALSISEEQLGENHPDTAASLNNLAGLYKNKGRYDEAESLYLRALKIHEEQLGENHPNTATSLNNLAELYKSQKRNSEAIPLLERWKAIKRERQETQNKSHANRIWTLGKLYEKCQQFPQAVAVYEETLFLLNHLLAPKQHILFLKAELARLKKNMKKVKK